MRRQFAGVTTKPQQIIGQVYAFACATCGHAKLAHKAGRCQVTTCRHDCRPQPQLSFALEPAHV